VEDLMLRHVIKNAQSHAQQMLRRLSQERNSIDPLYKKSPTIRLGGGSFSVKATERLYEFVATLVVSSGSVIASALAAKKALPQKFRLRMGSERDINYCYIKLKMDTSTLVSAATNAQSILATLWDSMGVSTEERNSFLSQMSSDVSAIYATRVAGQTERKSALEAEIISLQTTIRDMRVSMDEPGAIVSDMRFFSRE
jgi:hypothetical protein